MVFQANLGRLSLEFINILASKIKIFYNISLLNVGVLYFNTSCPPSTPWNSGCYFMEYRGYSLEPPLHTEINVFLIRYIISPTKNQNIEKISSDSEP